MGVQRYEDGDTLVLRWGVAGRPHAVGVGDGDDTSLWRAYRSVVAEGLASGEPILNDVERSVARELGERIGVRMDAGGGLIVAWFPFDGDGDEDDVFAAAVSALGGGEVRPEDVHLTLLYLGDPADWDVDMVVAVTKLESLYWTGLEGLVGGLGRFVGDENTDVLVALVDCPGLEGYRRQLMESLSMRQACVAGTPYQSDTYGSHGYVPHLTVGHLPRGQASPAPLTETIPFTLDSVTVASGTQRVSFDFSSRAGPEEDPSALFAARERDLVERVGRVLSGKSLAAIEAAIETLRELAESTRVQGADAETEKRRRIVAALAGEAEPEEAGLLYVVSKAHEEQRYTLGPLYAPDRLDAHGEWTDGGTLQQAVWGYVRESASAGRRINLQHGDEGDVQVAEWVEIMAWPYEHTIKLRTANGEEREVLMPAGTVYLGALWDADVWPAVKSGKLAGWSLGGKAVRVTATGSPSVAMGDTLAPRKLTTHDFVSNDDMNTTCKICKLSRENGNHPVMKSSPDERLVLLRAALTASADEERRHREEIAEQRRREDDTRGLMARLVDAVKNIGAQEPGDVHVHLPEQTISPIVNINEAPLEPEPPEGS